MVGVLDEAAAEEVVELRAPLARPVERGRVALLDLEEDAHGRHLVVRRLHLRELDQRDPQRPNVHLEVVRLQKQDG